MYSEPEPPVYNTLREALQSLNNDALRELRALLPITDRATRKDAIIASLLDALEGDGLRALWDKLDNTQQSAVAETLYRTNGVFDATRFRARYGEDPNWGTRKNQWFSAVSPSLLSLLFYRGTIPRDLQGRLREFAEPPPPFVLGGVEAPPEQFRRTVTHYHYETRTSTTETEYEDVRQRTTEHAALTELPAMLRLAAAGKMALSEKTLQPTPATLKNVMAALTESEYYAEDDVDLEEGVPTIGPIRAFAWPLLLYAGGLVEMSGKKLALSKAGQKALSAPPAETLKALWQRWLKTGEFDELRRINNIRGQTGNGKTHLTAPRNRRPVIVEALKIVPPGRWIAVNDFFRYIQAETDDFTVTRNPWTLYIEEIQYGTLGEGRHLWALLQGRFILCLLFEYAATLGLLDVAYVHPEDARPEYRKQWGTDDLYFFSRYDGLVSFRLTPLGAYCLDLTDSYTPPVAEARVVLRVLPNREVVFTERPVAAADRLYLGMYAEPTSEAVWKLDENRLLTRLEEGGSLTELREWLEARSGQELPDTVTRLLQELSGRADRLTDQGAGRLVECRDAALFQLITHDPRTRRYCIAAGDKHLLIPADSEAAFRKALRQLGYILPR